MSNLVQQFSPDYFSSRFTGAFFINGNGIPSYVVEALSSREVLIKEITGSVGRLSTNETTLDASFFSSLKVFRHPPLGWRSEQRGRVLVHLSKNVASSTARALSGRNLYVEQSPITKELTRSGKLSSSYITQPGVLAKLVLTPTYIPFDKGVAMMRDGRLLSFCTSSNLAVAAESDDTAAILWGPAKVGAVNLNTGDLTLVNNVFREELKEVG